MADCWSTISQHAWVHAYQLNGHLLVNSCLTGFRENCSSFFTFSDFFNRKWWYKQSNKLFTYISLSLDCQQRHYKFDIWVTKMMKKHLCNSLALNIFSSNFPFCRMEKRLLICSSIVWKKKASQLLIYLWNQYIYVPVIFHTFNSF